MSDYPTDIYSADQWREKFVGKVQPQTSDDIRKSRLRWFDDGRQPEQFDLRPLIRIQLLPGGRMPTRATAGAAGWDLYAVDPVDGREVRIISRCRATIPLGFRMAIPPGWEAQIRPRSGLSKKYGVLTSFGTIDSDYRGEVAAIIYNHGPAEFRVYPGDRIAQMLFARVPEVLWQQVDSLDDTDRGSGGFGSTGR